MAPKLVSQYPGSFRYGVKSRKYFMIGPAIVTRATSGPLPAANCTGRLSRIDLYGILSMTTSMSGLSFMNRATVPRSPRTRCRRNSRRRGSSRRSPQPPPPWWWQGAQAQQYRDGSTCFLRHPDGRAIRSLCATFRHLDGQVEAYEAWSAIRYTARVAVRCARLAGSSMGP